MTEVTTGRRKKHREKLVFLMVAGAIGIILLVIGGYQLIEFTDSTAFCGRLCHQVMYPEYTAYQASPHSRVLCSECHVGSGAGYLVKSKLSGVPQFIAVATSTYDRPIPTPVENLRPARETCAQCHRPERFAGDLVRVHTTYETDETNTEHVDTRVLRVGGGELEAARKLADAAAILGEQKNAIVLRYLDTMKEISNRGLPIQPHCLSSHVCQEQFQATRGSLKLAWGASVVRGGK